MNPNCGVTDAVTEPVVNNVVNKASGVNAERGMSNNPAPLPLYIEPDANVTLPLISIEPVNSEPLAADLTTNPLCASVDAVTEPVAIIVATKASGVKAERGISNNPAPLPVNIDADTLPPTLKLFNNSTEPVNCCLSVISSPNIFEPDE